MLEPLKPTDLFIKSGTKDTPHYVYFEEYEDGEGNGYRLCCDQDGEEWTEEL